MKNNIYLKCLVSFCLCFGLLGCKEQIAQLGEKAPEIAAFDLAGNKVELSQWQGKPILLTFWSGNCGICLQELKQFEQHLQHYPQHDLQVIAMNTDGENANVEQILEKHKIRLFVVKDQLKISAERYQLIGTPTSFVIDRTGKILYKFESLIPDTDLQRIFQG